MAPKKQAGTKKKEGYTLAQIKDKYLPNRDLASLEEVEVGINRENFLEILRRTTAPTALNEDKTGAKTSK